MLVPRGVHGYSTGTAQAVLDLAPPGARLVFSSGWHISRDSQDIYSWRLKWKVHVLGGLGKLAWAVDLDDQVEACRRVFASDTRWTVVRGSELEEGPSQGLPMWSRHVGDPILASNLTRRDARRRGEEETRMSRCTVPTARRGRRRPRRVPGSPA